MSPTSFLLAVGTGVVVIVVAIAVVLVVFLVTMSMRGRQQRAGQRRSEDVGTDPEQ
jgi:hypothetical protein